MKTGKKMLWALMLVLFLTLAQAWGGFFIGISSLYIGAAIMALLSVILAIFLAAYWIMGAIYATIGQKLE